MAVIILEIPDRCDFNTVFHEKPAVIFDLFDRMTFDRMTFYSHKFDLKKAWRQLLFCLIFSPFVSVCFETVLFVSVVSVKV
jgi:hypothetical protein